jgi:hypothetical protein
LLFQDSLLFYSCNTADPLISNSQFSFSLSLKLAPQKTYVRIGAVFYRVIAHCVLV